MRTINDALGKVRSLLGDPRGGWVKDSYVLPIMDLSCSDIILDMKAACSMNLAAVVPILNVPPGTSSLYPWQGANLKPGADRNAVNPVPVLAGLTDPLAVYIKPAGSKPENYKLIRRKSTLPHFSATLNVSNGFSASMNWDWIGNQLHITPINTALDIEVTGRFSVPPLVNGDLLVPGGEDLWIPLVFDTAAIAGIERSNPQILQGYAQRALVAKDNLRADLTRQGQGEPARFQKVSRDNGNGYIAWFWGL